jgi:D-alanyl-D-alanine carboxypeptidase
LRSGFAVTLNCVPTKTRIFSAVLLAAVVLGTSSSCAAAQGTATQSPEASASQAPSPTPTPTPTPTPSGFNKQAQSITNPNSYWVVVNKLRPLNPLTYWPSDIVQVPVAHNHPAQMRKVAADALVAMFAAGQAAGAGAMQVQSSFRSYSAQKTTYDGWVRSLGIKQADIQSARAGYSEHQTGLAVDISAVPATCALAACFGTTPQGKWLAANAWQYGYLLRYPADKTAITGYEYEPWHFRYIGVPLATEMHNEGVETLEEFFGLPPAPNYAQ